MITLNFKAAKEGFFDRVKVMNAMDKATHKVFNEFGRKVRSGAQASLVYDEKPSRPGDPPHAHRTFTIVRRSRKTGQVKFSKKTGKPLKRTVSLLREYLFYSFDKRSNSVVIGPAGLSGTVSKDAPHALEYGGPSTIKNRGQKQRINIRARPFMRPAAAKEIPKLPPRWRNSVR